jgi:hypothetical protein
MLNQGSQSETRRTKVAGPTIQSLPFRVFSRCRDFLTRLGVGRDMTGGLMAAPHLGQNEVLGDTSIRQREHAGKSTTLLPAVTDVSAEVTSRPDTTCPDGIPTAGQCPQPREYGDHYLPHAAPANPCCTEHGAQSGQKPRSRRRPDPILSPYLRMRSDLAISTSRELPDMRTIAIFALDLLVIALDLLIIAAVIVVGLAVGW